MSNRGVEMLRSLGRNNHRTTLENVLAIAEDTLFDWMFGTETARHVEQHELDIRNDVGFNMYTPTRVRAFRKLLDHLALPKGQVFVDFGCGKGRVLLAAAQYPFDRIVGVEVAPQLCAICRSNVAAYRRRHSGTLDIKVVQCEARAYNVSRDETVFFMFSPFGRAIAAGVLGNILSSVEECPRKVWLIVNNPREIGPSFDANPNLDSHSEFTYGSSLFWIWTTRSGSRS